MNPQDQNQPTPEAPDTSFGTPETPTSDFSTPQPSQATTQPEVSGDDAAALQQIESLEAESTTPAINPVEPATPGVSADAPVDTVATSTPSAEPTLNSFATSETNPLTSAPTDSSAPVTSAEPTPVAPTTPPVEPAAAGFAAAGAGVAASTSKKPSKALLIILAVVVVLALGVAGYLVWQSTQSTTTTPAGESSEVTNPDAETGGSLPGGDEPQTEETPTDDTTPVDETAPVDMTETTTPVDPSASTTQDGSNAAQ